MGVQWTAYEDKQLEQEEATAKVWFYRHRWGRMISKRRLIAIAVQGKEYNATSNGRKLRRREEIDNLAERGSGSGFVVPAGLDEFGEGAKRLKRL